MLNSWAAGTLVEARQSASIADLLRFTLPTLGIWLIGPILSLADTAFVGSHVRAMLARVLDTIHTAAVSAGQ